MKDFFGQYEEKLKEGSLSDNTVNSYVSDVKHFLNYCEESNIKYIHEITGKFLNGYLEKRKKEGAAASSVNRSAASLRSYFRFLKDDGYYFTDPSKNLNTLKVTYKNPDYLSEREINNLCDFGVFYTPKEYRDTLMISLCVYMGLNVTEVCSLKLSDVNLNVGTLMVSQGKHSRRVVLSEKALKRMEHYINTLRPVILNRSEETDALFPSSNKKAISRQGFWKNLNSRCKRLKIKKKISPNSLKYSYMVRKIEDGASAETVMQSMGYLDSDAFRKCSAMLKEKYQRSERKVKRGK